jgi:hypothetical protein
MKLRSVILPVTSVGSKLAGPIILLGIIIEAFGLVNIGIALFGTVVIFQLLTLPVEFNASSRALYALEGNAILTSTELHSSKKVLTAAALTYVAALAMSLMQLIRLIALSRRR